MKEKTWTDVSAKYRGAFCEAKIKTAKRLVKAKVTFKPDLSTAEVHDENIKGPLKVGAVVEVKNQDGVYQEATINKLTDASIYTVVFDDGDEKTLRRSSLCLKGARHFAESETLDRLPLTNPEHFGTPVIGKKGNRGRRSNPIQEEEMSSSSSEEEESDQRQNEDLFGKVVCVEGVTTGDKKKTTWYPALVISPDCHEDVTMKKDNIFVRSFKDGKFYTVLRKDVREMNSDCPPKADAGLKPALDAAMAFQQQYVVPGTWKTEVKEESSSSEDDDDDEEEEQEEDASGGEEEEEVELFPEERENFLQQLYKFMEDRGTPINKRPVLGYRNLNLFKLYRLVHKLGGFDNIESGSVWKQVYQDLGIPVLNSAAGYNVKCAYRKYLYGFEEYCTSTAITFRMDLPLKQAPKGEVKSEGEAGGAAATSSSCEEQTALVDEEPCSAQVYDEWIKADKIVRPANKNVPKIKHRKKIKRLNDREGLGPSPNSNRVPRSKCGLSQDVFSKMDEGEDKGTQQSPVKSIEITSILNGLQASEMSTDESEHEDDEGEHNEEDRPGCRGSPRKAPPEPTQASERWESAPDASKPSPVSGKSQDAVSADNADVGKRRSQPEPEPEASTRKRKSEGAAERTPKGQSKAKTRSTRSADWLPGGSPRKLEERAAGPGGEERGALSSSSSDDEGAAPAESQAEESERSRPKAKGSPSKKYNGMKEKAKTGRQAGFWEIPEKRAKMSGNAEERPAVRSKGQKDVWSSIQAQWPKKTLKELFSDSDTEAANSPPPPVPSCLEEPSVDQDAGPEDEASEEQMENDKLQEFPSSGSNSVLNTPPTTPESPSGGGSAVEDSSQAQPSSPQPSLPPEEVAGGRSETDSSTVEVESLGGELQDLPPDERAGSPSKVFDVSLSCNSSSSYVKAATSPKCHGRSPPSSHKYHKQGDADHAPHRDNHGRSPRVYKWSFQMCKCQTSNSLAMPECELIKFRNNCVDIICQYLSPKMHSVHSP
uniref:AT-rich interactive domain-containing protein 4B n=1 Tax=Sparus aurata TaxID=8175 RepID=A0A671VQV4_SPAAU